VYRAALLLFLVSLSSPIPSSPLLLDLLLLLLLPHHLTT
jgi:hypothetical protein